MDGTRKDHPEWGNPITKEHTWYALTDKWILALKLGIHKTQFTDHMKLKNKEDQSVDALVLLRRGNKILMGGNMETKYGTETEGKATQRQSYLGIILKQSPNSNTIMFDKKCLMTIAWYSCLLRDSAIAWQIQRWVLVASHWTEHRVHNGGVREITEGSERVCNP